MRFYRHAGRNAHNLVALVGRLTRGGLDPDDGSQPAHGRAKTSAGRSARPSLTFHAVACSGLPHAS